MLECRTYSYAELSALLHTRDRQGIVRRFERWEVKYTTTGRGTGQNLRLQKSEIRSRSIAYWTSAFPHKQILRSWPFLPIICYATMNFSSCRLRKWKNTCGPMGIHCPARPFPTIFCVWKRQVWFAVDLTISIILHLEDITRTRMR